LGNRYSKEVPHFLLTDMREEVRVAAILRAAVEGRNPMKNRRYWPGNYSKYPANYVVCEGQKAPYKCYCDNCHSRGNGRRRYDIFISEEKGVFDTERVSAKILDHNGAETVFCSESCARAYGYNQFLKMRLMGEIS